MDRMIRGKILVRTPSFSWHSTPVSESTKRVVWIKMSAHSHRRWDPEYHMNGALEELDLSVTIINSVLKLLSLH